MTSRADFVPPPRSAVRLIQLFTRAEEAESILGDLLEEFSRLASTEGIGFARHWYWRQTVRTVVHLAGAGFRTAPWSTTAAAVGGLLLLRLVSGWPELAIFAVLRRYRVFDHHFKLYLFFATDGIAFGHIVASMFVGYVVALAAKGRELIATMMLDVVLCAMAGTAYWWWVSRTGDYSSLWILPWQFVGWLAILVAGAMVRTRRSVSAGRKSAA